MRRQSKSHPLDSQTARQAEAIRDKNFLINNFVIQRKSSNFASANCEPLTEATSKC